jgi:hypothetical protein
MANDGMSSMTDVSTAISRGAGAPARQRGLPLRDTASGTVITAEIPAVPVGPSYGVLLPDGSVWYPGSRKRLPAPLILRVFVWILAFAVFLAGAGDFVVRYHPSWVAAVRHIVPAQSPAANTASKTTSSTTAPAGTKTSGVGAGTSSKVTLMTPQPHGLAPNTTAYSVASSAYTVTITAGSQNAWVAALPSSNCQPGSTPTQEQTLTPGKTLTVTQSTGDQCIHIGANGTTIKVYHVYTVLAAVPTPASCPCYVLLEPARS